MRKLAMLVVLVLSYPVFAQNSLDSAYTFASVPAPGMPESVARDFRGNVYVSGPSSPLGTAGLPPSRVWKYSPNGTLVATYVISGENTDVDHNALGLALDAHGRIYVATSQLGVVRIDPSTYPASQSAYSHGQLPTLPVCSATVTTGCVLLPMGPQANGIAFDPNNNDLIVSDFFQGAFWRIHWGGSDPVMWYQDPLLSGFGPNGMAVNIFGNQLYFAFSQPPAGAIYRMNLLGTPARVLFHQFDLAGPDGIALGLSGKLYVASPILNQIIVLSAFGCEERRITSEYPPLDGPTSVAFTGTGSLLVTSSSAIQRLPENMAVLSVLVNDPGLPVYLPW